MDNRFRIPPVIPLSYSEKHKAVKKELMVDYDTGDIYIVSAKDKDVIFNITAKISDALKKFDNSIDIEIEGIGKVSLKEIISKLNHEVENTVQIIDTDEDTHYIGQEAVPDNRSVENEERNLQLKGFSKAPNLSMPRKKDGKIEWVDYESLTSYISGSENGVSVGNVIPPSNPNDGNILYCYELEPLNGKIFLRGSKRQKSNYIHVDCKVILPKTLDEHSEIEWYVVTNSFAPKLTFSNNIIWRNQETQPVTEGHQVYTFKSWDFGRTWLGELVIYDGNKTAHGMDTSYIDQNFYKKSEIDKSFCKKNELEDRFITQETLDENYMTKQETHNLYYNKKEVKEILSWKDKRKVNKE